MKTPEEIFNAIWELDYDLNKNGLIYKCKIGGKSLTLKVVCIDLYYDIDDGPVALYMDDAVFKPACKESKWVYDYFDIHFGEHVDIRIPKDIQKRIDKLNSFLKGVDPDLVECYFDTVFFENTKNTNLNNYIKSYNQYMMAKKEKKNQKTFKLNSQYTAIFSDKGDIVKVGCQSIPKKVIKELAAQL